MDAPIDTKVRSEDDKNQLWHIVPTLAEADWANKLWAAHDQFTNRGGCTRNFASMQTPAVRNAQDYQEPIING